MRSLMINFIRKFFSYYDNFDSHVSIRITLFIEFDVQILKMREICLRKSYFFTSIKLKYLSPGGVYSFEYIKFNEKYSTF